MVAARASDSYNPGFLRQWEHGDGGDTRINSRHLARDGWFLQRTERLKIYLDFGDRVESNDDISY